MNSNLVSSEQGWYFADCTDGAVDGPAVGLLKSDLIDNGTFTLAREVLQNSIDARLSLKDPVVVEFAQYERSSADIPVIERLRAPINASKSRNMQTDDINPRLVGFYKEAERALSDSVVPILRISDFNTTGLTKPYAEMVDDLEASKSGWLAMVHGSTVTTKGGDMAGSFGEGKKVIFDHSRLKTLAVSTVTCDGEKAWEAVARIGGFTEGPVGKRTLRQGIGFWREHGSSKPLKEWSTFDPKFRRSTPGTDIEILGFNGSPVSTTNRLSWDEAVKLACLNDFFVAIHTKSLVVRIKTAQGHEEIFDSQSLQHHFDCYRSLLKKCHLKDRAQFQSDYLYEAFTTPSIEPQPVDFGDKFENSLVNVAISKRRNVLACTAMVRSSGMRITNLERRNKDGVIAVATIEGKPLNTFLAGLETSLHQSWSTDDEEDKQTLINFKSRITRKINKLTKSQQGETLEIPGLENYLRVTGHGGDERDQGLKRGAFCRVEVREAGKSSSARKILTTDDYQPRERFGADPASRPDREGKVAGRGEAEKSEERGDAPERKERGQKNYPDQYGDRNKRNSGNGKNRLIPVDAILRQAPEGLHLYLMSEVNELVDVILAFATEEGDSYKDVEIIGGRDMESQENLEIKGNVISNIELCRGQRVDLLIEIAGRKAPALEVQCFAD